MTPPRKWILGLAISFALTAGLAAGCSPDVVDNAGATSGGGSGGAKPASTAVGPGSTTSSSDASSSSGAGGSGLCGNESPEGISIVLTRSDGRKKGCQVGRPSGVNDASTDNFSAKIVSFAAGVVTFDECAPTADCQDHLGTIAITPAALVTRVPPVGAFVRVKMTVETHRGHCGDAVTFENRPNWDGVDNPVSMELVPWFGASSAWRHPAQSTTGFKVERVRLDCPYDTSRCDHADYQFRVTADSGGQVDVPMGSSAIVGRWRFQNVQSYTPADCSSPFLSSYLFSLAPID